MDVLSSVCISITEYKDNRECLLNPQRYKHITYFSDFIGLLSYLDKELDDGFVVRLDSVLRYRKRHLGLYLKFSKQKNNYFLPPRPI